jgi:DNA-binding LytR/AlgR family response regulator
MKIKTIVIDDEPLAREGIKNYIKQVSYLEFEGGFPNPVSSLKRLEKQNVDLIFLDIQMPGMSGIEFIKTIKNPPMVIITTAFPDYAIEGFELEVIDYLLKPVSFQKFLKAANKAKSFFENKLRPGKNLSASPDEFFFIKSSGKYEKVNFKDVLFIEAMQNYVIVHTPHKKYIAYNTLKGILESLPDEQFIRVQKSFAVAVSKIDSIEGGIIKIGEHAIKIGRENKDAVINRIIKNKVLKRK